MSNIVVDKSKVPWWVSNVIVPLVNLTLALLVSGLFVFIAGENPIEASIGFSPAIKTKSPETNNANVKFTSGTITLETHHGTFDLSTTILLIMQHLPLAILAHDQ